MCIVNGPSENEAAPPAQAIVPSSSSSTLQRLNLRNIGEQGNPCLFLRPSIRTGLSSKYHVIKSETTQYHIYGIHLKEKDAFHDIFPIISCSIALDEKLV